MVEDVEELTSQLELKAFGYGKGLGQSHIPGIRAGETYTAFADRTKSAGWIKTKCGGTEPILAGRNIAGSCACSRAIWISSDHRAVLSDGGLGVVLAREDCRRPTRLSLKKSA